MVLRLAWPGLWLLCQTQRPRGAPLSYPVPVSQGEETLPTRLSWVCLDGCVLRPHSHAVPAILRQLTGLGWAWVQLYMLNAEAQPGLGMFI